MRNRRGFTLMELVIVLTLGGILTAVVVNSFGRMQTRMAPNSAQSQFLTMHAHARALAVERAALARLRVDPATGIVSVLLQHAPDDPEADWELVFQRDFRDAFDVDIETSPSGQIEVAMTPRGYASPMENTPSNQQMQVRFVRGNRSSEVVLLPLGQALRP